MVLTAVIPRGRPQSREGTVRILRTGVARLSPDLCIGLNFKMFVDVKKKRIVLSKARKESKGSILLWYSNKSARSGIVSIVSAFRDLGLNVKENVGEYVGRIINGRIVIELSKKWHESSGWKE